MNIELLKNKIKDWTKQLLTIILYITLVIILQGLFKKSLLCNNLTIKTIAYLCVELIILTVFILIFGKTIIPDYKDFQKNGEKYIQKGFKYWILGLVFMVISNIIIAQTGSIPNNQELNKEFLFELPIYSIITTIIFAPIIEECMTKICLKDTFKHNIFYCLICGLIFGALHMLSATTKLELLYIIPYGSLGFAFAYMYKKTGNIWTNIFYHSLHNFIAITILLMWR